VYTDGSKLENGRTGYGVAVVASGTIIAKFAEPLPTGTTVYQAEVQAINSAATTLAKLKFKDETITIMSDSRSALQSSDKVRVRSSLVQDTIHKLNYVGARNSVKLCWIKAHAGWDGNELADVLAKEGASICGPSRHRGLQSQAAAKQMISSMIDADWKNKWKTLKSCRQSRYWFPDLCEKKSSELLECNRELAGELFGMMSGFNSLNYHQFNIGRADSAECRLCGDPCEDAIHITESCPAVLLSSLQLFGIDGPSNGRWNIKSLTKFIKLPRVAELTA
jgi:ribonuclease HI